MTQRKSIVKFQDLKPLRSQDAVRIVTPEKGTKSFWTFTKRVIRGSFCKLKQRNMEMTLLNLDIIFDTLFYHNFILMTAGDPRPGINLSHFK